LQSNLSGLVRRERLDGDTYVYHMGGPFLAKWLLNEKFDIRDSDAVRSTFSVLFDRILSDKSFSADIQKITIIRLVLKRLAAGWHCPVFNFPGRPLAKALFESSKTLLEPYLNGLTDTTSLVVWAALMNNLGEKEMARALYLKAGRQVQIPEEAPTMESMRTPFLLAMELADMSERSIQELAIPLFQKIREKLITAKTEPWMIVKVVHKLAETLDELGRHDNALRIIENLPQEVPLDALLWQKKGDILEHLERLTEAKDSFRQSIETARSLSSQSPHTLLNCLQHYANFLSSHRNLAKNSGEDPEVYLEEAKRLALDKKVEGYETVLNVWAKYKRNEGDIPKAKKLYEECISYCRQEGIISPYALNDFACLLLTHGSQFNEKSYEKWLAEAESFCWEVINSTGTDAASRRVSYHIVGMLVGSNTYTSMEGKQRPDFSKAVSILQNAFESPEAGRNDDAKKLFQDVITHNAIKNVYLHWSDSKGLPTEDREELLEKADFQFQRAFWGLPRANLNSPQIIQHVLEAQLAYAFFKWKRRSDLASADFHYKQVIRKREDLNYNWPKAYTLYEFYANFLYETNREHALADLVKLQQKALNLVPDDELQKRSQISHKLAHNLHSVLINELNSLTSNEVARKMDEVIKTFDDALKGMPNNESAATELAHIFYAPKRGILSDICSKERVGRVKDILWQVWDNCPTNIKALDGLFDIADSLIDNYLNDANSLNSLSRLINYKATTDEKAAEALCCVCNSRRTNPYRGMLTDILCGHR